MQTNLFEELCTNQSVSENATRTVYECPDHIVQMNQSTSSTRGTCALRHEVGMCGGGEAHGTVAIPSTQLPPAAPKSHLPTCVSTLPPLLTARKRTRTDAPCARFGTIGAVDSMGALCEALIGFHSSQWPSPAPSSPLQPPPTISQPVYPPCPPLLTARKRARTPR